MYCLADAVDNHICELSYGRPSGWEAASRFPRKMKYVPSTQSSREPSVCVQEKWLNASLFDPIINISLTINFNLAFMDGRVFRFFSFEFSSSSIMIQ
jgi:hypothetical protein